MVDETQRDRSFGVSVGPGGRRLRVDDTESRVLGIPQSWVGFLRDPKPDGDSRWVRHPVLWLQWRREVRRLGPYAPSFDDFQAAKGKRDA